MRLAELGLLAVTACGYERGALLHRPDGALVPNRIESACVDLVVSIAPAGSPELPADAPLVRLDFGNHCEHPVLTDFRRLVVTLGTEQGESPGVPFDPRSEIAPATLDARSQTSERILYLLPATTDGTIRRACFDATRVFPEAQHAAPLCFRRVRGTWLVEVVR